VTAVVQWSRVREVIRTTCASTPVGRLEEELVRRLSAEFDERDPARFPEPSPAATAKAAARLKALGL
jgi:hypothetical protein